jgi:Uncharacterized conserved protein
MLTRRKYQECRLVELKNLLRTPTSIPSMQSTPLDRLSRQTASALINSYQKHISPKKGFSCAHRVLHGGESCSQYIKRIILKQGLLGAIPLSRQRLQACKAANQVLKARRKIWLQMQAEDPDNEELESDEESKQSEKINNGNFKKHSVVNRHSRNRTCSDSDCTHFSCSSLDCTNLGCEVLSIVPDCNVGCGSAAHSSEGDFSILDCSVIECSGADCSGMPCNFGSCG